MNHLSKFIEKALLSPQTLETLPFVHTTSAYDFRSILENGFILQPMQDEVFSEKLVYFFYGKPAYRPQHKTYSLITAHFPVFLIIDAKAVSKIRRILPLDSGALAVGKFNKYFPKALPLSNLEIHWRKESDPLEVALAANTVSAFYKTNRNYFFNVVRSDLNPDSLQFEVECYLNLLKSRESTDFDDRASVIEISTNEAVTLDPENLLAVIAPDVLVDGSAIFRDALNRYETTKFITYSAFRSRPEYFASIAVERVGEFLENKDYFK